MTFLSMFENLITLTDIFIIVSLIVLIAYLNYIENPRKYKGLVQKSELTIPIYELKDVLFQSKKDNNNFPIAEVKNSIAAKILIGVLVFIIVITPLYRVL